MLPDSINKPAPKSSPLVRASLIFLLKLGRITRLLPRVRGFYKLRSFYQRFLPENFLIRTVVEKNVILDLDLRDNLGLLLWHFPRFYEKKEIKTFCGLVKPGSVVLDVGANVGLYTVLAARRGAQV